MDERDTKGGTGLEAKDSAGGLRRLVLCVLAGLLFPAAVAFCVLAVAGLPFYGSVWLVMATVLWARGESGAFASLWRLVKWSAVLGYTVWSDVFLGTNLSEMTG